MVFHAGKIYINTRVLKQNKGQLEGVSESTVLNHLHKSYCLPLMTYRIHQSESISSCKICLGLMMNLLMSEGTITLCYSV